MRVTFGYSALVALAATSLVTSGCGASVPTKDEAAAAVSTAIASRLTRTLPAATYCMTVDPNFSFASVGQIDLVEMFQNLPDKAPLYDATTAGVVRIELSEFRVDPARRSPDPACDAVRDQYKESSAGTQVRFAVVRSTLTEKGTAAGVQLGQPIEAATRELVDVTNIQAQRGGAVVTYMWRWQPTAMGEAIGYEAVAPKEATATLQRSDSGWTVSDKGVK
jgi:hypothetical protein